MVKKANGRWRMCMDYTDLNKACPKDLYPLPNIDRLVDGVLGYALLSFMDAYLGYNQIWMHPSDEEKTAFITKEGAGKFLGFMLTERGIESNPDKCQGIIDMRSPQDIKEVQQLMGKITALSRDYTTHFRGIEKGEVHLNERMRRGFSKTKNDDRRSAGFDTSDSKYLVGPKTGYQKIEKAALALVSTSRRLRPYFQNFSIIVQTDFPIRQMLGKPYLAGWMVAWSIQLSEFDISFESRGHIKAQVIADFLVELTPGGEREEKGEWYLLVDGSSNHTRSGARIILEGPTGILIEQSLHFEFKANNN
ncbi:hypothetical protein CR513_51089, partial [Mucuna pruriens]